MDYIFETRMMVRDYECDIEGIVNNANYLHYAEHTRHLFLRRCGLSFADMHRYVFYQDIFRASDGKLCFRGVIDVVCLVNGKLAVSRDIDRALMDMENKKE